MQHLNNSLPATVFDKEKHASHSLGDFCAQGVSHSLIERQQILEKEMADRGSDRYFSTISRCKEKSIEATTSYGKILLKQGIAPLSAAITSFMEKANTGKAGRRHKAFDMLKDMNPDVVAFIALRKALDTLTKSVLMQRVAIGIAREVELEKKLTLLQKQDAERYSATQRHIQSSKTRKYRKTVLQYAFGKIQGREKLGRNTLTIVKVHGRYA